MLPNQHAVEITNRCPPASPELAMAGRVVSTVSKSVIRGEKLAKAIKYALIE
jgi:hypothetical protein